MMTSRKGMRGVSLKWAVSRSSGGMTLRVASLLLLIPLSFSLVQIPPEPEAAVTLNQPISTAQGGYAAAHMLGDYFTENRGQTTDGVRYYSDGNPAVAFRDDGVLFVWREALPGAVLRNDGAQGMADLRDSGPMEPPRIRSHSYLIRFEGSMPAVPVGRDKASFDSNFFIGNDSSKWRTDVPNYKEVVYENLYEGIDLVYRTGENGVKYEFVVHLGADPRAIRLKYDGVESIKLDVDGIVAHAGSIEVRDSPPYSYEGDGEETACRFAMLGPLSYGFGCDPWDTSESLVIDPLIYSTFIGGGDIDSGWGVSLAVDAAGNAYVTGYTASIDFPVTPGAYDTLQNGDKDVFVSKLAASGASLIFSTFLGGNGQDSGLSITVDSFNDVYVGGGTFGGGFPVTPAAFDTSYNGGEDGFVAKLSPAGNSLMLSTYLGGGGFDRVSSIVLNATGYVHLIGVTSSSNFPTTPGAYDVSQGGSNDGFAAKFDSTLSMLIYATFLGDDGEDEAHSLAVDPAGNMYICGHAGSGNFPTTPGAYDPIYNGGNADGFVLKLDPRGSSLLYSTFLGGSGGDDLYSLALEAGGAVHVTGKTVSSDYPTTPGAYDRSHNGAGDDVVVTSLDPFSTAIIYSTFVGGSGQDVGNRIILDSTGNEFVTGLTSSTDFPVTPGAFDTQANGNGDAFVLRLDAAGSKLLYSTYIGGSSQDRGDALSVVSGGSILVAGSTGSPDFPITPGAFDTTYNGGTDDIYLIKLFANNAPHAISLGVQSYVSAPGITHITDFTPDLNWTYSDIENDPQTQYEVRVSRVLGGSDMWALGTQAGAINLVTYAGAPLVRGTDYWFGVRVSDGQWGDWTDLMFHVNSIPTPPPAAVDPMHMSSVSANPGQQVSWAPSTDAEFDAITYEWQAATDASFTSVISSGTTTATSSSPFATSVGETIYWRVRARDDYEPATWSDYGNTPPGYWMFFIIDNPPTAVAYAPFTIGHMDDFIWFDGSNSSDDVGIVSYLWEFGDSAMDTNVITSHRYSSRGTFTANLTVRDNLDQNDTDSLTIDIQNRPPIADAGPSISVRKTLTVTLDGGGSSDPDSDVLAFAWTQILGPAVSLTNAGSAVASFTAVRCGSYLFMLVVGDGHGGTDSDTLTVNVWGLPPVAVLTASPQRTFTGISIRFDGASSHDPDGVIISYSFDFDDGTVLEGTADFRNHVYAAAGTYNVTLAVRDDDGNTSIAWAVVIVDPPTSEPNWKPLVALMFSITLGLLGIWSSRRHPWKGIATREAALKTWCCTALPFVVVEAVTGIVSMFTGLLGIPPVMGLGTVVDVLVLGVGIGLLVVLAYTGRRGVEVHRPAIPP
jgi:hypothetical protein